MRCSCAIWARAAASSLAGTTDSPAWTATSAPSRSNFRQLNNWLALMPCLRATSETLIPGSYVSELRADEATTPTRNGRPNIFHNEDRDGPANARTKVGAQGNEEAALRKGLGKPNPATSLATQMSHLWIYDRLKDEKLTATGEQLESLVESYMLTRRRGTKPPYQRWVTLVTGRQLHKHQRTRGSTHEIQVTLDLPDNILER